MRRPRVAQLRSMNPVPVGIGFIVCLLLIVFVAFNVRSLPFLGDGTTYTAYFVDAAGLHTGDRVRVAGIDVGQVKSIELAGQKVKVTFTVKGAQLGTDVRAEVSIFTLLGNKYIALRPGRSGTWPSQRTIPLSQTTTPYDVTEAFQDVSDTAAAIDTKQLAGAFDAISTTFRDSPPAVRSMLRGLSRLSQTVASRDEELGSLLQSASGVTGVLSERRDDLVTLMGDGSLLLKTVNERKDVIDKLLTHSRQLARQLRGLVADNEKEIGPMLDRLHSVVKILEDNQASLQEDIQRLFVWTRRNIETIGAGPWFDGEVINFTNPFQSPGDIFDSFSARPQKDMKTTPQTWGDLLGVPRNLP